MFTVGGPFLTEKSEDFATDSYTFSR